MANRTTRVIVVVSPEQVIVAHRLQNLPRAHGNGSFVIPDNIGVVAAARHLGKSRMD